METKKNKSVDYVRKRGLFLSIGLCLSSLIAFSAFQIKSETQPELLEGYIPPAQIFDEVVQTRHKEPEPPKPKPQPVVITVVDDEIDLPPIEVPELVFDEDMALDNFEIEEPTREEAVDNGIVFAEVQASFPGGKEAWAKFLQKNLKYPKLAKRSGIEGKVLISFVVDKNGNTSDIEVLRGIGGGCDDEAVRVIKMAPKWNPGLQRGNPVKSRMNLYIHFLLK